MASTIGTIGWQWFRSETLGGIHVSRAPTHGEIGVHDHVFHEIVYVEAGTAEHVTTEATRRLRPGDLIVIRPQVWHGYHQPRQFTIINCLFDKRLIQHLAPLLAQVQGSFELFRRPSRHARQEAPTVLHLRPAQRPAMLERLERIITEQREQTNGWQAAAVAALLDVLVTVARLSRQQLPDHSIKLADRSDQAVLDTASHLEANYTQPVQLADLAQRVHLSPAHLSRSFSRRMGMGIVEFVHQLRCEEACRLLRWSDQSISRIAITVGYDEIAYFSRCFRRQIGHSPRDYARRFG
jgi:AraC-like DNA-binding protein